MKLEADKVISERYEVKEQLGSGGMAIVYRATDLKLDRSVTLKVMRDDLEEEGFIERFYKEAQSVASLDHHNIVKVYDYGEDDGIHYIVMEYVDGTSLKELINKKAPFDEETTLGISVQIANGLLHAHKNEVVHRDIKPQNILVTRDGSVKIADFGIARAAKATTLTSNANSMGSVHYFSPEQARGGFVDHKSDIYALGITMFEMATGTLPYDGETAVAVALKHINDPFPDPQEINHNISNHLRHIICKAAEKSSTKRYAAIEDMYRDMKRTINNIDFLDSINFEDSPTVQISQVDRDSIRQQRRDFTEPLRQAYDDEGYEEPGTDRKMMVLAFSTAAVLVALITVAAVLLFNNLRPQFIDPPDIIGLPLEQARAETDALGIVLNVLDEEFSEVYDSGIVIHQSAMPGDNLRQGDAIHVVVSRGSAYFPMPDVIFAERDVAQEHLNAMYLQVQFVDYDDPELAAGIVVQTEPEPGEMVSLYQVVTLHVNLGPDNSPFAMISLLGMNEIMEGPDGEVSIVEWIQDELRLIVRNVSHQPNVMYPAGTVSSQSIRPGEPVMAGDMIDIVISTGAAIPTPTPTPPPQDEQEPAQDEGQEVNAEQPPPEIPDAQVPPNGQAEEPPAVPENRTLNVALWGVPEESDSVRMIVLQRAEGSSMEPVGQWEVPVDSFPIQLPIAGSGLVEFFIFSVEDDGDEILRARQEIDFSVPQ